MTATARHLGVGDPRREPRRLPGQPGRIAYVPGLADVTSQLQIIVGKLRSREAISGR